jgi:hypothetical protein
VSHLQDVVPVVEALADDLPGMRDDRREVGSGEIVDDAGFGNVVVTWET